MDLQHWYLIWQWLRLSAVCENVKKMKKPQLSSKISISRKTGSVGVINASKQRFPYTCYCSTKIICSNMKIISKEVTLV